MQTSATLAGRIEAARASLASYTGSGSPGLAQLTLGPLLGQGTYGKVYRGYWQGSQVAVKALALPLDGAPGGQPVWSMPCRSLAASGSSCARAIPRLQ